MKSSIRIFRKVLIEGENVIIGRVVLDKDTADDGGVFGREHKEHQALLDRMIEEYIARNEAFLRESFDILILGRPVQYDFSKSRYFNRTYVQRILQS